MAARRLAGMLGTMLCCLPLSLYSAPVDQAHQRARATFAQKAPLALDDQVLDAPWVSAPFEASAYTYTFDEIRQHWSTFMRGLGIPFPSPDYLKARYQRFPSLYRDLRYQDDNWEQHSRNVLEVWQAFSGATSVMPASLANAMGVCPGAGAGGADYLCHLPGAEPHRETAVAPGGH